ncbi:hypothetical protein D3C77_547930 [compost metagenome]
MKPIGQQLGRCCSIHFTDTGFAHDNLFTMKQPSNKVNPRMHGHVLPLQLLQQKGDFFIHGSYKTDCSSHSFPSLFPKKSSCKGAFFRITFFIYLSLV